MIIPVCRTIKILVLCFLMTLPKESMYRAKVIVLKTEPCATQWNQWISVCLSVKVTVHHCHIRKPQLSFFCPSVTNYPDAHLHPRHPACTLFFPLVNTVCCFGWLTQGMETHPPSLPQFFASSLLHLLPLQTLVHLLPTLTYVVANNIVHRDSCLTSSVSLSITTANTKGLRADPRCNSIW